MKRRTTRTLTREGKGPDTDSEVLLHLDLFKEQLNFTKKLAPPVNFLEIFNISDALNCLILT